MSRESKYCAECVMGLVMLAISIIVLSVVLLVLLKQVDPKDANYLNAIATAFIAVFTLCTVYISFQLKKISEGQATTQMNQAFNEINQLILNNDKIRGIAMEYIMPSENKPDSEEMTARKKALGSGANSSAESSVEENTELRTWFIFNVLNIYEAYYLNNKRVFSCDNLPLILQNLRKDEFVKKIVRAHGYHSGFKNFFECGPKSGKQG